MTTTYTCNLPKRWHVFLNGAKACQCCLKSDPELQRCKHRPQAEVRVQDDDSGNKEETIK